MVVGSQEEDAAALAAALTGMFRTLEARPLPEHILRVVEQLDASAAEALKPNRRPSSSPEP
jgi:hypothetical protein